MKIKQHIKFWLDSADHDLEAAESLFNASKYDWCLFLGHLVLEKALKAVYVRDNANEIPPRSHNLVKLAEATNLKLDEDTKLFLDEITYFNLEVRYPDYKNEFYKRCSSSFCEEKLIRIKDLLKWIKKDIQSNRL